MSVFGSVFGHVFGDVFGSVDTESSDDGLQALLDPLSNFSGIRIIRRMDAGAYVNYYFVPYQYEYRGRSMWVQCNASDNNANRYTTIINALTIPAQPDSGTV